jgi:hypothetical protein
MLSAPILLLGAFLLQLVEGCGNYSNAFRSSPGDLGGDGGENPASAALEQFERMAREELAALVLIVLGVLACVFVVVVVVFLLQCWLKTGYLRMQREALQTGHAEVSTLFRGGDALWRMARWRLLSGFVIAGNVMVAAIPGVAILLLGMPEHSTPLFVSGGVLVVFLVVPVTIYVQMGLALGDYFVALEGASALGALERAWDAARGNRLWLFLYTLVLGLLAASGVLVCCVGIIVSRCVSETGATEAFLLFTRPVDETRTWRCMTGRPPETALSPR